MPANKDDATMTTAALRIANEAAAPEAESLGSLARRLDATADCVREDRDAVCRELVELEIDLHSVLADASPRRAEQVRFRMHLLRITLLRTETIENLLDVAGDIRAAAKTYPHVTRRSTDLPRSTDPACGA